MFVNSIPYSFYPILAVIFVLMISASGRDFGPMLAAEIRARGGAVKPEMAEALPAIHGDELEPKERIPLRAMNAFVPILSLIAALMVSLYALGEGDTLLNILETTSPYQAMMYSSFVGVLVAAVMSIGQRILSIHETVDAWYGGLRATLFGMIILVLAWSLSDLTATLNTAAYLVTLLADSLPVALLPALVFILAAITAFTTGTSWGTMAILMPLIVPLCWAVMRANGMADDSGMHIMYSAVACCLGRSLLADFRYDGAVVRGQRLRPHRTRPYAIAVRAPGWRCGADRRHCSGRLRPVAVAVNHHWRGRAGGDAACPWS